MVNFFEEFKPIRNNIRKFNLWDILHELYKIQKGKHIPEILEFIYLNSIVYSSEYKNIKLKHPEREWSKLINGTNELHEKINALWINEDVWGFLHKQYLNQLKAKPHHPFNHLYRHYFIFSHKKLSSHIERMLGISYHDFFLCAWWIHSVFDKKTYKKPKAYFFQEKNKDTSISSENINTTLETLSINLTNLKTQLKEQMRYDMCTFITHEYEHIKRPILESGDYLYCLYPDMLLNQLTSGVYYLSKIYDNSNNLNNSFGLCFEQYVGIVLGKCKTNKLKITKELKFNRGQNKTSDWIVEDNGSIVFIECKTKRLKIESKKYEDIVESDIGSMVDAAFQVYKVFHHYSNNEIPGLNFQQNKYFIPMIITLEEWYAGIPDLNEEIKKRLKVKLKSSGIEPSLVEQYKFRITSISNFELDIQMMSKFGFKEYYDGIKSGKIDKDKFDFKTFFLEEIEHAILTPLQEQFEDN